MTTPPTQSPASESGTPRTDAKWLEATCNQKHSASLALDMRDHSRTLETELSDVKEKIRELMEAEESYSKDKHINGAWNRVTAARLSCRAILNPTKKENEV